MPTHNTVTILSDANGFARARAHPRWLLRVVKGPDRRREKSGSGDSVLIGSGEGADLQLSDPTVSAIHCRIVSDERGFRAVDLGAKNGVKLGKHRIQEAWLEHGDELTLGSSVIRFKLVGKDEERPLSERGSLGGLLGGSVAMRALYADILRLIDSETTVLIRGETGTGKELVAEALVKQGPRRSRPFEIVDCGRLTAELAESELFGHEEGAFTGAHRKVIGAFERAADGTLFLDEVGELPLSVQTRLLGALERRSFLPVGAASPVPMRARVISATHRDLEREVNEGRFRADLYYRLAVVVLRVPSLRERREDVPHLIAHFLEQLPERRPLAPSVLQALSEASFPGNVRELRNAVERAAIGLEPELRTSASAPEVDVERPYREEKQRVLDEFQRAYLRRLFDRCDGNVSELARRSGLDRMHLTEVLKRLGIAPGAGVR